LKQDIRESGKLSAFLKGRTLWCACHLAESLPSDYSDLIADILQMCSQFSQEESAISVKLVAVKTIIKYSRKVKDQELLHRQVSMILDDVIALLNRKDNFDYIYLPIEAIAMISKTNEQQISEVAPKVTPKLLLLFRDC